MICSVSCQQLQAKLEVNGDKSISHRAILLSSLAEGTSLLKNLSDAQDVLATIKAMQHLGVSLSYNPSANTSKIEGLGLNSLCPPDQILDLQNSGTGARLLIGLLSSYNFTSIITGDMSLCQRPMARVVEPLLTMGAQIEYLEETGKLPIKLLPNPYISPTYLHMKQDSAQVKTAIMFAALNCQGVTTIFEKSATRDHSERLFAQFGANIKINQQSEQKTITIKGQQKLTALELDVPGDFSSAAFFIVAALITPNSKITLRNVGINPTRTGLLTCLKQMGARIKLSNQTIRSNEPVADITAESSNLKAINVLGDLSPTMIDEYPILAIAASQAEGTSVFNNIAELRFKESDRIATLQNAFDRLGFNTKATNNQFFITGDKNSKPPENVIVKTKGDHRIAMSFLIMSLASPTPIFIDDSSMIKSSFPNFLPILQHLGCNIITMRQR